MFRFMSKQFIHAISVAAALSSGNMLAAEEVTLSQPTQGVTLHDRDIDMSLYFLTDGTAYDVHGFYVTTQMPDEPLRVRLRLEDGDDVRFGLPGHRHVLYHFRREGPVLRVSTEPVARKTLALQQW